MTAQDLAVELYYDGAWHDITADDDVFTAPIVIKRGQSDEATQLRPASITMQLANDDDKYRTSNPVSPLYGKAGRNTPARVSVGSTVRVVVEASSWAADQSQDFRRTPRRGKAWVDFEGGGLLQRVGGWTEPLRSPFYTYNTTELTDLVGYWPMEDPRGATSAFSPVAGASNPTLFGVSFDSQLRPPGSGPLADVVLADASTFQFARGTGTSTTGWQYSECVYMGSLGGSFFTPVNLLMTDGSAVSFSLNDSTDTTVLIASDAATNIRFTSTNAWPAGYQWAGRWIMLSVQGSYSGGTTTIDAYYRAIDSDDTWHVSGTFSGEPSMLYRAFCSGLPDSSTFGHVIGVANVGTQMTNADRFTAFKGHAGETAADRFARLMTLKGLNYTIIGTAADSMPMGPQPVASFPDHLKEIISTEDALLFDDIDDIALVLLLRNARYNQDVALDLTPTDLPRPPVEVTDNLGVHNVVTASQRDGGDATAEDSTSPLGSQPPPDGVGEEKQTVDVNLDDPDAELAQEANWWLRRGTVNLPRFPQVTVNLGALDADKAAEVDAVEVGDVITLTGFREYVIRLFVLGYTETIRPADHGKVRRTITFTCAPDQQFVVGVWDSTASRWDSATHFLKTGVNTTDTALTFRSLSSKVTWSTTTPYKVTIAGEDVTVTSMGAASLVSGGYDQVATVARSVNGVVKSLSANEPIRVATPGRWAL